MKVSTSCLYTLYILLSHGVWFIQVVLIMNFHMTQFLYNSSSIQFHKIVSPESAEDELPESTQRATSKKLVEQVKNIFQQKYGELNSVCLH